MAKVRCLFLLILAFAAAPLWAQQPGQPVRLELPFGLEETAAEVIALPDSSLLVYHKTSNAWHTQASFHFTKYNHQLEEVWNSAADIAPDYDFIRYFTEEPFSYFVFEGRDPQKYVFVRLHLGTGAAAAREYELETIDAIYEYSVLHGNYFLIGRNRSDGKPLLLHLSPASGKVTLLPTVYGQQSTFSDMLADPAHGRLDVVLTESNGRISRLQVKSFDASGKLLSNHFILQQDNQSLLNAEITPGDSASKILIGTYGARDLRYTQGFFTTPVASSAPGGQFYNMLQLKNSLKYMKARREENIRRREAARLKAGKLPAHRYRLLLHDLIPTPYGYVLAAEAYYPQYRDNTSFWNMDRRAVPIRRTQEGYKRTHAVALGFDKNGMLLWDNIFPLEDVTSYELVHTIEVSYLPDGRVVMAYPLDDKIIYRILEEDRFKDEETELELLPYEKGEKIQESYQEGIIKWYGSNFAAFGFQRLKPAGAAARTVFYINKISF